MARAVVDPNDLRRFAHNMKLFITELKERLGTLQGQFLSLGDTWRDQEHEKFAREFEETLHMLGVFTETAAEHIPFLLRKAERIEEYLQQR